MFKSFVLVAATIAMLALGCSDDDDADHTPSATAEATRSLTPVETPPPVETPAFDIRDIDLTAVPEIDAVLNPPPPDPGYPESQPGVFSQADVIYADVTIDGHDDAVVPIFSEGMQSGIGFFLVTLNGETPVVLLQEFPPGGTGGVAVSVEGEKIVMTQAAPGPDDPECCPSQVRRTVYAWNGNAMAVENVTTDPNPALAGSPTPQS